jgi:hypothetical protein
MLKAKALKLSIPLLFKDLLIMILKKRIEYIFNIIKALY